MGVWTSLTVLWRLGERRTPPFGDSGTCPGSRSCAPVATSIVDIRGLTELEGTVESSDPLFFGVPWRDGEGEDGSGMLVVGLVGVECYGGMYVLNTM